MQKNLEMRPILFLLILFGAAQWLGAQTHKWSYQRESGDRLILADFNQDGRMDIGIAAPKKGFHVGFQQEQGTFSWRGIFWAPTSQRIVGLACGPLLKSNETAVALLMDKPAELVLGVPTNHWQSNATFRISLGDDTPEFILGANLDRTSRTGLHELYVAFSSEMDPARNRIVQYRNIQGRFQRTAERTLSTWGRPLQGTLVRTHQNGPEVMAFSVGRDETMALLLDDWSNGHPRLAGSLTNLPSYQRFAAKGATIGSPPVFYFYSQKGLITRVPVERAEKVQFGEPYVFDYRTNFLSVVPLPQDTSEDLLVSRSYQNAHVLRWDASGSFSVVQTVTNIGMNIISGLLPYTNGFFLFQHHLVDSRAFWNFSLHRSSYERGFRGYVNFSENEMISPWLHQHIKQTSKEVLESEIRPYTNTIPGFKASYAMMPIPGGEFLMGSPDTEPGRQRDEGPVHRVKVEPFWMGKCEVTWDEFEIFWLRGENPGFQRINTWKNPYTKPLVDAVTCPTTPISDPTFGMGKYGYPVGCISHHAAMKYCQWLSAMTGQFYRLPTEAEWEYACRAGTQTAFYFGDDPKLLPEHAWYGTMSDWKYQKVGRKLPNPWGLHDMYGNVMEWCLDRYEADFYSKFINKTGVNPWNESNSEYPHVLRGGCWDDDQPSMLRSARRAGSSPKWNVQDPQLPKGRDFLTDAQWVGFRIVRPLKLPPPEELAKYWKTVTEWDTP